MGFAWAKIPDIEWYAQHHCPACGAETLLEGIVTRRFVLAVVVPLPLWRDWYVRCRSCRTMWKVTKATWRERARTASKPEDVYQQSQAIAKQRRAALPSHLVAQADRLERKGWTFGSSTDTSISFWRETKGMLIEWLRVDIDHEGQAVKQEKWVE